MIYKQYLTRIMDYVGHLRRNQAFLPRFDALKKTVYISLPKQLAIHKHTVTKMNYFLIA